MARVLVVDDDLDIRELMQTVLELHGYNVRTAEHGKAAIEALREETVDIVLLDLDMPVMNGKEFLCFRRHDKELSQLPVVIISANTNTCCKTMADGFLPKPIDVPAMLSTLMKVSNR